MRATKATLRKQGDQCARESVENTTRITIRPFRTHKPALLEKNPTGAAFPARFSDEAMWIVGTYTSQARSYPHKALD